MIDALCCAMSWADQRMSRFSSLVSLNKPDRQSFNRLGRDRDLTNVLDQQLALLQELLSLIKRPDAQDYSLNAGRFGTHEADPRAGFKDKGIV